MRSETRATLQPKQELDWRLIAVWSLTDLPKVESKRNNFLLTTSHIPGWVWDMSENVRMRVDPEAGVKTWVGECVSLGCMVLGEDFHFDSESWTRQKRSRHMKSSRGKILSLEGLRVELAIGVLRRSSAWGTSVSMTVATLILAGCSEIVKGAYGDPTTVNRRADSRLIAPDLA
jgi:hypothetical protein